MIHLAGTLKFEIISITNILKFIIKRFSVHLLVEYFRMIRKALASKYAI